jgi:hypothetical protein
MTENQYIKFLGVPDISLGNTDPSAEWVDHSNNILRTIQEYREYSAPGSSGWLDYVLELFHLLGLQTLHIGPRLFKLSSFDGSHSENAIALILNQEDDPTEVTTGITWSSYLFYVCKHYKIEYGMITDGKRSKLYDWNEQDIHNNYILGDLDSMILTDAREDFGFWLSTLSKITGSTISLTSKPEKRNKITKPEVDNTKPKPVSGFRDARPMTPPAELRFYVIEYLRKNNGSSIAKEVVDYVGDCLGDRFTEKDLEMRESANELVWRNNVKWERQRMVQEGLLKRGSPYGIWELSD